MVQRKVSIWDDTKNQKNGKTKKEERDKKGIMKDTQKKSKKETWTTTGRKWERRCPDCGKILTYSWFQSFEVSRKRNKVCGSCSRIRYSQEIERNCPVCNKRMVYSAAHPCRVATKNNSKCRTCNASFVSKKYLKGKPISEEHRKKCSNALSGKNNPMYGKHHSKDTRNKISNYHIKNKISKGKNNPMFGRHHTEKTKQIISKKLTGRKGRVISLKERKEISKRLKGKKFSDEHIQNIRRAFMIRKMGGRLDSSYNPKACKFINEYGNQNGYNFQHAENGGEFYIKLGYFVDGYDKEKNVVFEYDEPHHYFSNNELKPKDEKRMNKIKQYLGCKFIRYNERTKQIKEY